MVVVSVQLPHTAALFVICGELVPITPSATSDPFSSLRADCRTP